MVETIPKAPMSPPERCGSALGLAAAGPGIGGAAALAPGGLWAVLLVAAAVGLGIAFAPGRRLQYQRDSDGLRIGRQFLPYAQIDSARLVRLRTAVLLWGLSLPGCWWGTAWSPALGRFQLRASTGLGQALMLQTRDGRRYVITPADPAALVVSLQGQIGHGGPGTAK